jgi:hypothetical protein
LIYEIENPLVGLFDYICDQETVDKNTDNTLINSIIVGGETEATTVRNAIRNSWLEREAYRFHISKIENVGNGLVWKSADLENDSEEGNYQVFNHTTGTYEPFETLTLAKDRLQEIKDESVQFIEYRVVDKVRKPLNINRDGLPVTITE